MEAYESEVDSDADLRSEDSVTSSGDEVVVAAVEDAAGSFGAGDAASTSGVKDDAARDSAASEAPSDSGDSGVRDDAVKSKSTVTVAVVLLAEAIFGKF